MLLSDLCAFAATGSLGVEGWRARRGGEGRGGGSRELVSRSGRCGRVCLCAVRCEDDGKVRRGAGRGVRRWCSEVHSGGSRSGSASPRSPSASSHARTTPAAPRPRARAPPPLPPFASPRLFAPSFPPLCVFSSVCYVPLRCPLPTRDAVRQTTTPRGGESWEAVREPFAKGARRRRAGRTAAARPTRMHCAVPGGPTPCPTTRTTTRVCTSAAPGHRRRRRRAVCRGPAPVKSRAREALSSCESSTVQHGRLVGKSSPRPGPTRPAMWCMRFRSSRCVGEERKCVCAESRVSPWSGLSRASVNQAAKTGFGRRVHANKEAEQVCTIARAALESTRSMARPGPGGVAVEAS